MREYFSALMARADENPHDTFFDLRSAGVDLSFAAMKERIGAIPAFMPPPTSRQPLEMWTESHRALLARINPQLIVCEDQYLAHAYTLGGSTIVATSELEAAERNDGRRFNDLASDLDTIAFLQHSSGTTGLKKGVTVTYRQLLAQVDAYAGSLGFDPREDCVVSWLPIYHDMGLVAATLVPFVLGAPVHLLNTFEWLADPASYIDLLAENPRSFSWLPNFALGFLAQRGRPPTTGSLASVRAIINCSEPCKAQSMDAFRARYEPYGLPPRALQASYGTAEYVFAITQTSLAGEPRRLLVDGDRLETAGLVEPASSPGPRSRTVVSVGPPVAATDVRIGSTDLMVDDVVGELWVRGPSLCSGYFANEPLTAEKFVGGWYRTGDLGFAHEGELFITGRTDDVIVVRGRNLYAHDIELLANQTGTIKPGRVVAFGVYDDALGTEKLVIAAELGDPVAIRSAALAIRAAVMDAYGVSPADIVLVEPGTLIKTTSGKISRSENLKRYCASTLTRTRAPFRAEESSVGSA